MFKKLISPVQAWLLSQNRCVACGAPLQDGTRKEIRGQTTVTCRCGRIFVHDQQKNSYRRALFSEV